MENEQDNITDNCYDFHNFSISLTKVTIFQRVGLLKRETPRADFRGVAIHAYSG
jgi:hypothetical protein